MDLCVHACMGLGAVWCGADQNVYVYIFMCIGYRILMQRVP